MVFLVCIILLQVLHVYDASFLLQWRPLGGGGGVKRQLLADSWLVARFYMLSSGNAYLYMRNKYHCFLEESMILVAFMSLSRA